MEDYSERRFQPVEQALTDTRLRIWVSLLTALATTFSAVGLLLLVARQDPPSASALLDLGISVAVIVSTTELVATLVAHERRLLGRLLRLLDDDPAAPSRTVNPLAASGRLSDH